MSLFSKYFLTLLTVLSIFSKPGSSETYFDDVTVNNDDIEIEIEYHCYEKKITLHYTVADTNAFYVIGSANPSGSIKIEHRESTPWFTRMKFLGMNKRHLDIKINKENSQPGSKIVFMVSAVLEGFLEEHGIEENDEFELKAIERASAIIPILWKTECVINQT